MLVYFLSSLSCDNHDVKSSEDHQVFIVVTEVHSTYRKSNFTKFYDMVVLINVIREIVHENYLVFPEFQIVFFLFENCKMRMSEKLLGYVGHNFSFPF